MSIINNAEPDNTPASIWFLSVFCEVAVFGLERPPVTEGITLPVGCNIGLLLPTPLFVGVLTNSSDVPGVVPLMPLSVVIKTAELCSASPNKCQCNIRYYWETTKYLY